MFYTVNWNHIPLYVVGESSATLARTLLSRSNTTIPHQLTPGVVLGGAEATSAEQLAYFIRRHVEERARASLGASRSTLTLGIPPQDDAAELLPSNDNKEVEEEDNVTVASSHEYGGASVDTHASTDSLLPSRATSNSPQTPTHPYSSHRPGRDSGPTIDEDKPAYATPRPNYRNIPAHPPARPRTHSLQYPTTPADLMKRILAPAPIPTTKTKLLFLVGDKTRDVLPAVLDAGNPGRGTAKRTPKGATRAENPPKEVEGVVTIEVDGVQVYGTRPRKDIGSAIDVVVRAYPNGA